MIKNIFFDFDGVILDSVNAKAEAFYELYLPYGKDVAHKVVKHHKANGGMSRFDKIPYYHKTFLNRELNDSQIAEICEKFSQIVFWKVVNSPKVEGIEEFLENYYRKMKFWVISATPTNELKKIIETIGFEKYFVGVYGSPKTKSFWLNKVMEENNLHIEESILIGDSITDYATACSSYLRFVLRETNENIELFCNKTNIYIKIYNYKSIENKINVL